MSICEWFPVENQISGYWLFQRTEQKIYRKQQQIIESPRMIRYTGISTAKRFGISLDILFMEKSSRWLMLYCSLKSAYIEGRTKILYNYFGTLAFIVVLWMTGQLILKCSGLSKLPWENMHFISIPLGMPACAIVAALLYFRMGLSVNAIRVAYIIIAGLAMIVLIRKKGVTRREIIGLAIMLAIFHVMLIPAIWNGEKYYVHRGNIYDQYFYLSEVVYMSLHKITDIGALGTNMSDVYAFGYGAVCSDRPVAPLLCAVLAGKGWGNLFFQAHLFLLTAWMSVFGAIMLAAEMLMGKSRTGNIRRHFMAIILLGLLYIWGFFGQIQYDINAWSQLVSLSGLIAFVCIYFLILNEFLCGKKALNFRSYLLLFGTGTGLFLIYPENTMLYGAFLVLISLFLFMKKKRKIDFKIIGIFASLPILIVVLAAILHFNTVRFAFVQIGSSGSANRQGWASYFDAYWQGYHPLAADSSVRGWIKKLICFVPSLFGMYIITPDFQVSSGIIKWGWIGIIALLTLGIFCFLIIYLFRTKAMCQDSFSCYREMFRLLCYTGLAVYAVMMVFQKYWSAGKLFLYISPFVFSCFVFHSWKGRIKMASKRENIYAG